jgi:hypothetical protein
MSGTSTVPGVDDGKDLLEVDAGLATCNFTEDDRLNTFKVRAFQIGLFSLAVAVAGGDRTRNGCLFKHLNNVCITALAGVCCHSQHRQHQA